MFIFNYSDQDFKVANKGLVQTLPANELTYVDENWVPYDLLKRMFGNYVELAEQGTAIEEYYFDNQLTPEFDRLYFTQYMRTGSPRIFIKNGSINIYFSDNEEVPTSKAEMEAIPDYQNLSGLVVFPALTKYMCFEVASGTPKVTVSNVYCYSANNVV